MKAVQPIVIAAILVLGGCISLLPEAGAGPDIYRLSAVQSKSQQPSSMTTVLLPLVQAPRELKNNRVALTVGDHTISYAANARWASSTPEMLQALFADNLRKQGDVGVVFPADGINADQELRIILHNFEANYDHGTDQPPLAVVRILVRLIDRNSRALIKENNLQAQFRARDLRLGSIVAAIDQAAHDIAMQTAYWVAKPQHSD